MVENSGYEAWYARIQELAGGVHAQVRLVVVPEGTEAGDNLVYRPIEPEPMTMAAALEWAEAYLGSDKAKVRGERTGRLLDARVRSKEAAQVWALARSVVRDIEREINEDIDQELADVQSEPITDPA